MLVPGGLNERGNATIKENDLWKNAIELSLTSRNPEVRVLLWYDGSGKGADRDERWTRYFLEILFDRSVKMIKLSFNDRDTLLNT